MHDPTLTKLGITPADVDAAIKGMYYDTANATFPATMAALLKEIPLTQIMFGTDYPYFQPAPQAEALRRLGLGEAELLAIDHGNAERLMPRLAN